MLRTGIMAAIPKLLKLSARTSSTLQGLLELPKIQIDTVQSRFEMTERLKGSEKSVWLEFGRLATEGDSLNFEKGFSDNQPPDFLVDALRSVTARDSHFSHQQYTRSYGHPRLVNALASSYTKKLGRPINPMTEVMVSVGAYGALFFSHLGLINPGEEVIILEPFFDSYLSMVKMAQGIPRFVTLKPTNPDGTSSSTKEWTFDRRELEKAFNSNTKLLIFNNPNNPLGKIYSDDEMHFIADLCKKFNVVVVADEVYEKILYPDSNFIHMANIPGMYERTITIASAGKAFSVTGWKLGWAVGPPYLIQPLCYVHQSCNYTCPTPLQEALALCVERENVLEGRKESYFYSLQESLIPKKKKMMEMVRLAGIEPIEPEGGYFLVGDISDVDFRKDESNPSPKDYQFVKWMSQYKKISALPVSAFYTEEHRHLVDNFVRFCFFRKDETLQKAHKIFQEWHKEKSSKHI